MVRVAGLPETSLAEDWSDHMHEVGLQRDRPTSICNIMEGGIGPHPGYAPLSYGLRTRLRRSPA